MPKIIKIQQRRAPVTAKNVGDVFETQCRTRESQSETRLDINYAVFLLRGVELKFVNVLYYSSKHNIFNVLFARRSRCLEIITTLLMTTCSCYSHIPQ